MTTILSLLLFVSTCYAAASASNNATVSQAFAKFIANPTNVVSVARRETACTPTLATGTDDDDDDENFIYYCNNSGYTQVPNPVWIATTTEIHLERNAITFIPANAFDGLTMMMYLQLQDNAITSISAGALDTNIALWLLQLDNNDITSVPVGMLDNNPYLIGLALGNNDISSVPVGLLDNKPQLQYLKLGNNTLVCSSFNPSDDDDSYGDWVVGTAFSSICTSCTDGTPEMITIDTVDFWQCPTSPTVSSSIKQNVPLIAGLVVAGTVVLCIIVIGAISFCRVRRDRSQGKPRTGDAPEVVAFDSDAP